MHFKKQVFSSLLIFFFVGNSICALAQSNKPNFQVSAFNVYGSLPTNTGAIEATKQLLATQFQGWSFTCDKLNGMFTDIYGIPFDIEGNSVYEKSQNCLNTQLSKIGLKSAEWVKVNETDAPKANYVNYKQVINNSDVVFSKLSFRFTKDGKLARIQMKNYGSISKKAKTGLLTRERAKDISTKDLAQVSISNSEIDPIMVWFPVPVEKGYELRQAWSFKISGNIPGSVPLKLTGYLDATDGKILYRSNQVKETSYNVTVKGVVYKNGMLMPSSNEPLSYLKIVNGSDTVYTDTAGYASDGAISLPYNSAIPLKGRWSTVIDSITGLIPTFHDTITVGGSTFTYPTTAPSSERHVNAYYHVNRVHNYMKTLFPTFTGMDFSLPTNVDLPSGTCNAFYDGTSINFYPDDAACHSFATFGDVIYHEYGHGITDHFYTNITGSTIVNGSLGEALSDIWALNITHSPILAANAFFGYGGFIRRYDMTPQVYPIDLNTTWFADVHQNGQIIAGAWWDLGVNLGNIDTMAKIFADVYYDAPDGPDGSEGALFQTILIDALMSDDNDGNLFNGTPHYAEIIKAFARHGIYLEGETNLIHTELINQPADVDITVHANLTITRPQYFHDLTLYYRLNNTGTWNSVVMANTSYHFTGIIPAQTAGNVVEYYFVIHDSLNKPNAYFPLTCNPDNPAIQSSIPYQFGVGLFPSQNFTFDASATGWGISGNPGDNATAGVWQRAVPVTAAYFNAWPSGDHTSGSGKCLITGDGSIGFSGQSIANGTTSVVSPLFNLTSFINPIISYYRWFSNDKGSNFKNDPWVVKIFDSDAGTTANVEETYQSDFKWRRRIFPLHTYLPAANKIRVKFYASDSILTTWDNNGQSTTVCGIDDFIIYDKDTFAVDVNNKKIIETSVFPNPADNKITITFSSNVHDGNLELYDLTGKKLIETAVVANILRYDLDVSKLPTGYYQLIIKSEKLIQYKKILVEHL